MTTTARRRPPAPTRPPQHQPQPAAVANLLAIIAANVRRRRLRLGLNQAALAAAIGCARGTVNRIEAGTLAPGWQLLAQLATALNCRPNQLLAPPEPKKSARPA